MVKRVTQLYPAYWVIAVLYLLVGAGAHRDTLASFDAHDAVGNALMLTGWGLHVYPLVSVSWAASSELGSYFLLPVLLVVMFQRGLVVSVLASVAALAGVVIIAISGLGSAGPLDVTNGDSFLPLLRAVAGFAGAGDLAMTASLWDGKSLPAFACSCLMGAGSSKRRTRRALGLLHLCARKQ